MTQLFVYGTLRRNSGNALSQRLEREARWLGPAFVRGKLVQLDGYPGLIPGDDIVSGEIWEFEDALLEDLDHYEGCHPSDAHPHEYRREWTLIIQGGTPLHCWAYWYAHPDCY
jgi:gamma-glutamylcyclotransferase (GGCT)/AIG2-like uncharacterized protein YtfP